MPSGIGGSLPATDDLLGNNVINRPMATHPLALPRSAGSRWPVAAIDHHTLSDPNPPVQARRSAMMGHHTQNNAQAGVARNATTRPTDFVYAQASAWGALL